MTLITARPLKLCVPAAGGALVGKHELSMEYIHMVSTCRKSLNSAGCLQQLAVGPSSCSIRLEAFWTREVAASGMLYASPSLIDRVLMLLISSNIENTIAHNSEQKKTLLLDIYLGANTTCFFALQNP